MTEERSPAALRAWKQSQPPRPANRSFASLAELGAYLDQLAPDVIIKFHLDLLDNARERALYTIATLFEGTYTVHVHAEVKETP